MNSKKKQLQLLNYAKLYKIDVVLLQEHNIRKENVLCQEIIDEYHFEINYSIAQKGGTAIMINKNFHSRYFPQKKQQTQELFP